jgi:hypothetical protein
VAAGPPAELLPTSVNAGLDLIEGRLHLTDVAGTVAGTSVRGRLVLGIQQQPITVAGDLDVGAVNLPPLIALAIGIGAPRAPGRTSATASGGSSGLWPADPFEQSWVRLSGQIAVKAARVAFTPKLSAQDVRGVLHLGDTQVALQVTDGKLAGGRVAGELVFLRRAELIAQPHRLTDANAAELLPGEGVLSGRLSLRVATEGTNERGGARRLVERQRHFRSKTPAWYVSIRGLDTVIRAVDRGLPIDAVRISGPMDAALAGGVLAVPLAERRDQHRCRPGAAEQHDRARTARRSRCERRHQSGRRCSSTRG